MRISDTSRTRALPDPGHSFCVRGSMRNLGSGIGLFGELLGRRQICQFQCFDAGAYVVGPDNVSALHGERGLAA